MLKWELLRALACLEGSVSPDFEQALAMASGRGFFVMCSWRAFRLLPTIQALLAYLIPFWPTCDHGVACLWPGSGKEEPAVSAIIPCGMWARHGCQSCYLGGFSPTGQLHSSSWLIAVAATGDNIVFFTTTTFMSNRDTALAPTIQPHSHWNRGLGWSVRATWPSKLRSVRGTL